MTDVPQYMVRDDEHLGIVPELAALRDQGVVRRTPISVPGVAESITGGLTEAWLVTRYRDVRAVLADHLRFSSEILGHRDTVATPDGMDEAELHAMRKGNLQLADPPEHTRLRRVLMSAFSEKRMRELAGPVAAIVEGCLDELAAAGRGADFMTHVAFPVPSLVICELLGVPYAERAEFQARAARQLDVTLAPADRVEVSRASRAYMRTLVERAQQDPRDDLIGTLVREHDEDTETLTTMADLILLAGHQTTAGMLGMSVYTLLRHPDQLDWLRRNPARVDDAVEELLRFLSVVSAGPPRIATEDVEVGDTRIGAGELVVLSELAANRDPEFVADPDRLDLSRPARAHLAFGHGAHRCLGAALARLQLRIALPALLRRFPGMAFAAPGIEFREDAVVFSVMALPLTW